MFPLSRYGRESGRRPDRTGYTLHEGGEEDLTPSPTQRDDSRLDLVVTLA